MEKPKKTEVITFRTDKIIKEYLEEIANENQWSIAQVVQAIIQNYIINPNPGTIIIKAEQFYKYIEEIKKDKTIEVLEIDISIKEDEYGRPERKIIEINIPRSGGLGLEINKDYIEEITEEDLNEIK